ncbi:3-hydroxyacyl-CoA dehydrogenase NAD-binding domain-containing protein [Pseudohaliea sp.]|uniref:3-hydroxyacyl-CoA dehydrogenase NAD-binding domain-containing protein n=1 Tax=Pseudohaliea sp. TaxID=2740289 RepID=UPI0032EAA599
MKPLIEPGAVKRVAIVGTGLIGAGWTALFLQRGYRVTAWDPSPGFEEALLRSVRRIFGRLNLRADEQAGHLSRLEFAGSAEGAASASDFIQENAPEDIETKRDTIARLDAAASPDVVIASSSSGLPMSELQAGCPGAGRLVVGHPFHPVYLLPLVEIVPGRATAAETVSWAETFYRGIGKFPVVCNSETIGYIGNRLQEAVFREALHMVEAGEATVAQVDAVISQGPGLRWSFMGPFLCYHLTGGEDGIRGSFERFGAFLGQPYSRLLAPELTEALLEAVIAQTEGAYGDLPLADIEAWRDERLQALLSLLGADSEVVNLEGRAAPDGSHGR